MARREPAPGVAGPGRPPPPHPRSRSRPPPPSSRGRSAVPQDSRRSSSRHDIGGLSQPMTRLSRRDHDFDGRYRPTKVMITKPSRAETVMIMAIWPEPIDGPYRHDHEDWG